MDYLAQLPDSAMNLLYASLVLAVVAYRVRRRKSLTTLADTTSQQNPTLPLDPILVSYMRPAGAVRVSQTVFIDLLVTKHLIAVPGNRVEHNPTMPIPVTEFGRYNKLYTIILESSPDFFSALRPSKDLRRKIKKECNILFIDELQNSGLFVASEVRQSLALLDFVSIGFIVVAYLLCLQNLWVHHSGEHIRSTTFGPSVLLYLFLLPSCLYLGYMAMTPRPSLAGSEAIAMLQASVEQQPEEYSLAMRAAFSGSSTFLPQFLVN